jgi:hypothetical protein
LQKHSATRLVICAARKTPAVRENEKTKKMVLAAEAVRIIAAAAYIVLVVARRKHKTRDTG